MKKTEQTKEENQLQISIGNTSVDAKVNSRVHVEEAGYSGFLTTYNIDGYGTTQEFWESDSGVANKRIELRKSRSMMPLAYVYKRASDFKFNVYKENIEPQKKIANNFLKQFQDYKREGRGLFIYSNTKGSGKTLLACCLGNEVISMYGTDVKFISAPDYINLSKEKTDQSRETIGKLRECGLLILDDVGVESPKYEWMQEVLFNLIDYRYSNNLSSIFTSNYALTDIKSDDRIQSRIEAVSIPLALPEQSIRREKANEKKDEFLRRVFAKDSATAENEVQIWK